MITFGIVMAYMLVAVLVMRPVFGMMRARSIDDWASRSALRTVDDSIQRWEKWGRGETTFFSAMWSLAWPALLLVPVCTLIKRYVTGTRIKSNMEIEAECTDLQAEIANLERELGLKSDHECHPHCV